MCEVLLWPDTPKVLMRRTAFYICCGMTSKRQSWNQIYDIGRFLPKQLFLISNLKNYLILASLVCFHLIMSLSTANDHLRDVLWFKLFCTNNADWDLLRSMEQIWLFLLSTVTVGSNTFSVVTQTHPRESLGIIPRSLLTTDFYHTISDSFILLFRVKFFFTSN